MNREGMKGYHCATEEEFEWFLKYAAEKNYVWIINIPNNRIKEIVSGSSTCIIVKESIKVMWLGKISLIDTIQVSSLMMIEKMNKFLEIC